MASIVDLVKRTSDVETVPHHVSGILVGMDVKSGRFRLTVPDGDDYSGGMDEKFPRDRRFTVNRLYDAHIVESRITRYATETVERKFSLVGLSPPAEKPLIAT